MKYKLSVLIATLSSRSEDLKELLDELSFQIQSKPVQVMWLGDNKSMTVGAKRNAMMSMAGGEWLCFIDDDDRVSENYIDTILKAIAANPLKTVICFHGDQTTDGRQDIPFQYDIRFGRNHKKNINGQRWKVMLPDHLCVWRKSEIDNQFPDKSLGEDHDWARKMAMDYTAEDQVLLTDTLYLYHYNKSKSECRR